MPRPNGVCRTDFEALLLSAMAEAEISNYSALAEMAGTTTATIQRICSGDVEPSIRTLKKLAVALRCSVNELLVFQAEDIPPDHKSALRG